MSPIIDLDACDNLEPGYQMTLFDLVISGDQDQELTVEEIRLVLDRILCFALTFIVMNAKYMCVFKSKKHTHDLIETTHKNISQNKTVAHSAKY